MGKIGLDTQQGLYLGIDFGTTHSVVSFFNENTGETQTIPIDGANVFPTAVQFESDPDDETKLSRVFGTQAKEAAIIFPEATVLSVKRLLGSDEKVTITVDEKEFAFTPEQIAGEILGYIKQRADDFAQEEWGISGEFTGCVLTVPANATDKQKSKTKEAAVLAGFAPESIFLRPEPAAAAIDYAVSAPANKTVLVYDFGGGTFDACLLDITQDATGEPTLAIAATYGDNRLGGDDIDKVIMDMVYAEFQQLAAIDLFDDNADDGVSARQKKMARMRLQQAATQAKERLSQAQSTKIQLAPFIQEPKIVNINMEITREMFYAHRRTHALGDTPDTFAALENQNIHDLVNRTITCIDLCLQAAQTPEESVDEVIMVGGSSALLPAVEAVAKKFGKAPFTARISPALSISQGAAQYAHIILTPGVRGPVVQEMTLHPLGLEIAGRRFLEIVPAGRPIPPEGLTVSAAEPLVTNFDHVASMAIVVYEDTAPVPGDTPLVSREGMKRLAGTTLRGIPQAPKGQEKVQVTFRVGQDNLLTVEAQSLSQSGTATTLAVDGLY